MTVIFLKKTQEFCRIFIEKLERKFLENSPWLPLRKKFAIEINYSKKILRKFLPWSLDELPYMFLLLISHSQLPTLHRWKAIEILNTVLHIQQNIPTNSMFGL